MRCLHHATHTVLAHFFPHSSITEWHCQGEEGAVQSSARIRAEVGDLQRCEGSLHICPHLWMSVCGRQGSVPLLAPVCAPTPRLLGGTSLYWITQAWICDLAIIITEITTCEAAGNELCGPGQGCLLYKSAKGISTQP